uniref:Secreted protein n=1 Tax=Rhipicephalus appendiculatus TaxID=34631 RepID=A0A131Y958_RHIAP
MSGLFFVITLSALLKMLSATLTSNFSRFNRVNHRQHLLRAACDSVPRGGGGGSNGGRWVRRPGVMGETTDEPNHTPPRAFGTFGEKTKQS